MCEFALRRRGLEHVTTPSQDPQATPEGQRAAVNYRLADHSSGMVGDAA